VKARRLAIQLHEQGVLPAFEEGNKVKAGADNDVTTLLSTAQVEARTILRDSLGNSNEGWILLRYLKELKAKDPAFDYRIAEDSTTHAPVGVV